MFKGTIAFAIFATAAIVAAYYIGMCEIGEASCKFSQGTDVWGQFGEYIGGLLSPTLSFLSIVLLLKSLTLQKAANGDLRKELDSNERTEKLRTLDTLLFNMIQSLKEQLSNLSLNFKENGNVLKISGVAAILRIENEIEVMREQNLQNQDIVEWLDELDESDQLYSVVRAFYITVQMVSEKLENRNGFSFLDRRDRLMMLINFTDFAQLRLVLICLQFMSYHSTKYLRENKDFFTVLEELELKLDSY